MVRVRPRILIVTRRHERKNKWVNFVGEHHLDIVLRFGGVPVIVPRVPGTREVLDEYEPMNGLLIIEGEDIHPSRYGMDGVHPELIQEPDLEKDSIEFELIRRALDRETPYLGICRGAHLLNVASGGTLYADVMTEKRSDLKHISHDCYDTYRHPIEILPDTPLAGWFGAGTLKVNSYHHQGIKRLADGYVPMAYTPDGLLEAFYDPSHPFRMGLQFHPERMQNDYPGSSKVFASFLEAAAVCSPGKKGTGASRI